MAREKDDTIANRISRVLAERIIHGELAAGLRLRQDHIAEEFGASHVPVREAFRLLEAQGLAISEPRRGVRVASFDLRQVREVAEMRAALEGLALKHAAPHLTPAILDAAEEATREGDAAADVRAWEAANRRFHRLILTPCGMTRLLAAIDDLHAASARFLFSAWQSGWETRTDQDHRAILSALRHGRADDAAAILGQHVLRIGKAPSRAPGGTPQEIFVIVG
ncbi:MULTISPECIES: GntR family transcriptional regulator [Rhizobium]|uniref:GntR family transcriptional regulator n=1 Tax=Rhizobium rhododendri TaxID=2506430 RepID=A0ABY8IIB2_9HYPH|nr:MULTISPECIES: GntR family transcriptional regulator [Rhizobium]MBZ5761092.1 GntR family transcriptional regulator [Rhizobium sp. VS19-DR96]MBZ5767220.1 GntR family transcriptional regulator [Rhizobium sp. VS19-DR129.2]MBZ5773491.1 GntR family transcriptional regulator [Rhizobium sp. VS19-DRK62.2]MBZ5785532.1 GntR family transcriptional regulator [Rhizobium sp. VS19-DR121]MBZ5802353.1 GntR family transcriptional regulator [Rhizobium sp. VS19-DR181]